jgi:hypothetical protein
MADRDYKVGRGRPSRPTQFKKGQSGNPNGRPKGSRNLRTEMLEELRSQVTARENGREIRVSRHRLVLKSLIGKAAGGDMKAITLLMDLAMRLDLAEPAAAARAEDEHEPLAAEDRDILAEHERRIRGPGGSHG